MNEGETKIPIGRSIRRLLKLSGRHQVWLYLAMVIVVLETAQMIALNWAFARFFDAVVAKSPNNFWYYLILTLILGVVGVPLAHLHSYGIGTFSERTMTLLRERISSQATLLPMRYLEERHTGDLLAVVNSDLSKLKNLTGTSLLEFARQSLMALAALVTLFVISWPLALVSTLFIPVMIVVMSRLEQPIARKSEQMQKSIGETVSVAQDGLGGLMVTKAFNLGRVMEDRFRRVNQDALWEGLGLARLRSVTDAAGFFFGALPFLITFGFGGYLAISGRMSFGSLFMFVNLLNYVANPLSSLPPILASLGEASGAAQRTFQIFDLETERTDGVRFALDKNTSTLARFQQVSFAYGQDAVIQGVSFDVRRGQVVALVGPSGGGKSTLLKLLLGFYPLEKGHLSLFEHDLNDWHLPALRQQMAFVAQDTYLFPVSISENIACGKPGATQPEIERAARLANIHDFISSLPESYNTLVGERGARLSGGQRQRLSLARAILKDAPLLLLDEPTSALDSESEALVQEALEHFMADRTTIVIAHRLSTIREADRVLVLEGGRLIEEGTHQELMTQAGRYRELYLRQFNEQGLAA